MIGDIKTGHVRVECDHRGYVRTYLHEHANIPTQTYRGLYCTLFKNRFHHLSVGILST